MFSKVAQNAQTPYHYIFYFNATWDFMPDISDLVNFPIFGHIWVLHAWQSVTNTAYTCYNSHLSWSSNSLSPTFLFRLLSKLAWILPMWHIKKVNISFWTSYWNFSINLNIHSCCFREFKKIINLSNACSFSGDWKTTVTVKLSM